VNILHLTNNPLSGSPANIAHCQRVYGGHTTRLLLNKNTGANGVKHEGGELWHQKSEEELTALFEAADVVHMHNFCLELQIFQTYHHLARKMRAKRHVIQYHSDRYGGFESFEPSLADPDFDGKRIVLAQYQVRQYPECNFTAGNPLPLDKPEYQLLDAPIRWSSPPVVNFAPSNIHIHRGWDYKGADKVVPVLERLGKAGIITPEILTNMPKEECISRKRWAVFGIEELVTGSYHLSFLEYLALGCVTYGYLDAQTSRALSSLIGEEGMQTCPYIKAHASTLEASLSLYVPDGPADWRETGLAGRKWIEEYWSPKFHVEHFDKIYENI
jgi:hypothetical protein